MESGEYLLNTSLFNANAAGVYNITVGYPGYETKSFTVEVLAPTITGIEAITTGFDTSVGYGVTPEWENLIVKSIYQDNSKITIDSGNN